MVRVFSRIRSLVLVVGCVAGLAGCAGSVAPEIKRLPERVELSGTFYRGVANQSGPQVLASMLSQQGIVITPGLLEKPLHLPGAEAQLQQNMQNLAREYGMVVYPQSACTVDPGGGRLPGNGAFHRRLGVLG